MPSMLKEAADERDELPRFELVESCAGFLLPACAGRAAMATREAARPARRQEAGCRRRFSGDRACGARLWEREAVWCQVDRKEWCVVSCRRDCKETRRSSLASPELREHAAVGLHSPALMPCPQNEPDRARFPEVLCRLRCA